MYKIGYLNPNDNNLVDRVLDYVKVNADGGIRPRADYVMRRSIESGEVLFMERGGELAGCSFVYEFHDQFGDAESYLEIGTMLIPDKRDNGFRGQQVFGLLHIFNICFANDSNVPEIFAVVKDETASSHIMKNHLGLAERSSIPPKLIRLRQADGTPFDPKKMTVWANNATMLANLKMLRTMIVEENRIISSKGNVAIEVDTHPLNYENLDLVIGGRS